MPAQQIIQPADDGEQLVSAIEQWFRRFVVVVYDDIRIVLSLYVLYSYLWECFYYCPYISVTSPTPRCGKTTLATLFTWLCRRAILSVEISRAALFHTVDQLRPTLVFDENDGLLADRHIRALINAGFQREAAVLRCMGETIVPYKVGCPKILCTIGQLPATIYDRCILVPMKRAKREERVEKLDGQLHRQAAVQLSEAIANWANVNRQKIADCYSSSLVDFLHAREADLWGPLFAVAAVAVPGRLNELKAAPVRMIREKSKHDLDLSSAVRLLCDLKAIFVLERTDRILTERILAELQRLPGSPWNGLSSNALANYLRPFGIKSKQLWIDGRNQHGYRFQDFQDSFERYVSEAAEASSSDSNENDNNPAV
jgi:hypothetical protein